PTRDWSSDVCSSDLCGSLGICLVSGLSLTARVRVRTEVRVTSAGVRNMGVDLGRAQVGVAEHLLHAAQVGAALEQMRGERMAQEMGVDPCGVEAGLGRQAAEDEKCPGTGERAALGVQEELRAVPAIAVRPAARAVPSHRIAS